MTSDICTVFTARVFQTLTHPASIVLKRHRGLTRCSLCAEEFSVTLTLRRHLMRKHGLNADDAAVSPTGAG